MLKQRAVIGLFLGPVLFSLVLLMPLPEGMSAAGLRVAAVTVLMAVWWISEAIPVPATALLPIVLFPLLGILSGAEVTLAYGNHLIFMFMGGFLIAVTMERWNLHHRIALHTIRMVGVTPRRIVLAASFAFMLPVATPPNAIVFSSRCVSMMQMARAGFVLNLAGAVVITGFVYWLLPLLWGTHPDSSGVLPVIP